jgi:hypothetical protein
MLAEHRALTGLVDAAEQVSVAGVMSGMHRELAESAARD